MPVNNLILRAARGEVRPGLEEAAVVGAQHRLRGADRPEQAVQQDQGHAPEGGAARGCRQVSRESRV